MALTNYVGATYLSCQIDIYVGTGYTVDHLPKTTAQVEKYLAWRNLDAKYLTASGLGVVRVAMYASNVDNVDYCKITPTAKIVNNDSVRHPNVVYSGISQYEALPIPLYYFVTGRRPLNGGVVEFSLMVDCLTTMISQGFTPADFGGMYTRVPANLLGTLSSGEYTEFNTLVEPFTTTFRMQHRVRVMRPVEIAGSNTMRLVLSPYDLENAASSIVATSSTSEDSGEVTNSDTGSTNTSTRKTTHTYYIPTVSDFTRFYVGSSGSDNVSMGNYGFGAYHYSLDIVAYIAQLYAAGISNPVHDAYIPIAISPDASIGFIKDIYGVDTTRDIDVFEGATPTGQAALAFDEHRKVTYYNRYITLLSLSSGESQVVDWADCANSDGTITIATASDPSPNGTIYMRIRKTTESIPTNAVEGMLPGRVAGTPWRKIGLMATMNGQGVELGQAWRSAELDIDARTAELNSAATAAQYDLSIGNGYVLKNAKGYYAGQRLKEQNRYAAQSYNEGRFNRQVGGVIGGAASAAAAAANASESYSTKTNGYSYSVGAAGRSTVSSSVGLINVFQNSIASDQALDNLANSAIISQKEIAESGEYNTALLLAQSDAESQIAQSSIDKVELQRQKLQDFPTIPILSSETRGIINGAGDDFVLIESYMSEEDVARFELMLKNFGQSTYMAPDSVEDTDGTYKTPNTGWNFYKLEAPGDKWPHLTASRSDTDSIYGKYPGWLVKGAYDQLTAGVWFYKGYSGTEEL